MKKNETTKQNSFFFSLGEFERFTEFNGFEGV